MKDAVLDEIISLIAEQPLLTISHANEDAIISGNYKICNQIVDEIFEDYFAIEIRVPDDFPDAIPRVKTTDRRIRANNYKEHVYPDGTFCLETDTAIATYLYDNPSLLGFLTKYLNTYLCGFLYYQKHRCLPFGEHKHGICGLMDYYCELFETSDIDIAFALLGCIVKENLKGHIQCPCKSGLRYRNCHREKINELKASGLYKRYKADFYTIVAELDKQNKEVSRDVKNKPKNAR